MTDITIRLDEASQRFVLTVPGTGAARPHEIRIPANCNGMLALTRFLRERQNGPVEEMTLGRDSPPTQEMVEAWLRGNEVTRAKVGQRKVAESLAASVLDGLDLNDLEIDL